MDYKEDNCFKLMCDVVAQCFISTPTIKRRGKKVKETRRFFADSKGLELFCDCSNNFEHKKLKKEINNFLDNEFDNVKDPEITQKRLTEAVIKKIINLRSREYTYQAISNRVGFSVSTVKSVVTGDNIKNKTYIKKV